MWLLITLDRWLSYTVAICAVLYNWNCIVISLIKLGHGHPRQVVILSGFVSSHFCYQITVFATAVQ